MDFETELNEEKQTKQLIRKINQNLYRQVSLKHNILRGIAFGTGTVIGASIFGGIAVALISQMINFSEDLPVLRIVVDESNIEEVIDEQN
ncbi:MAG: DUF5665 domain-containing protein [Candidatus Dojkabacteria bacterium]